MPINDEESLRKFIKDDADRQHLYAAVGKVASNWAAFEHMLHSSLWVFAKVGDEAGACLTSQIPGPGRALDAFVSLVRMHGGDDALIKTINQFAEKTRGLGDKRNRAVHDSWNWDRETGNPYRLEISARKRIVMGPQPTSLSDMNTLVDQIADHIEAFELVVARVERQLGTAAGICFRPTSPPAPRDI
ncbi:MAG: hypothetical protein E7813_10485 [Bradyrhizobium sp.]|uniref:hypothetical protein n=1 Tax=Bradyrhizobium sp. TaxID=376 RepID=UPI0011F8B105|nr:hypothetical protein [Bradyrhizobium sp.]THD68447.1 MAG: hypothetical protein E7813_10485 [Bradyrhizobium sp.]